MGWQLQVLGETFREYDLTPGDFAQIEEETSIIWSALGDVMKRRAAVIRTAAAVLLAGRKDVPLDEALKLVDSITMRTLAAGLTDYDEPLGDDFPTPAGDSIPS